MFMRDLILRRPSARHTTSMRRPLGRVCDLGRLTGPLPSAAGAGGRRSQLMTTWVTDQRRVRAHIRSIDVALVETPMLTLIDETTGTPAGHKAVLDMTDVGSGAPVVVLHGSEGAEADPEFLKSLGRRAASDRPETPRPRGVPPTGLVHQRGGPELPPSRMAGPARRAAHRPHFRRTRPPRSALVPHPLRHRLRPTVVKRGQSCPNGPPIRSERSELYRP